jgi:putative ABC transport system permease protein
MQSLLIGALAADPLSSTAISTLLASVVLLACWIPVHKATKVDPRTVLRYD